jgi:hypothetical protein
MTASGGGVASNDQVAERWRPELRRVFPDWFCFEFAGGEDLGYIA